MHLIGYSSKILKQPADFRLINFGDKELQLVVNHVAYIESANKMLETGRVVTNRVLPVQY